MTPPKRQAPKKAQAGLISSFANAKANKSQGHVTRAEVMDLIKAGLWREHIEKLRKVWGRTMKETGGDRKAAKKAVDSLKKSLPAVTWSGTFNTRNNDSLLRHSGLLCADLDELGDTLPRVRAKLQASPHVVDVFQSPTGDGLKALFKVPTNEDQHPGSFRAVAEHVKQLTGVDVDEACKDVARLCFVSYDPDAFHNDKALEIVPLAETDKSAEKKEQGVSPHQREARAKIAGELLKGLKWSEAKGGYFCECPGKHLHGSGDGKKHCIAYLDFAPTIKCQHTSCKDYLEGCNRELRAKIGAAEKGTVVRDKPLPDFESADQLVAEDLEDLPPELIKGLLHQGTIAQLASDSKAHKTWTLLDLAHCVSLGEPFWDLPTTQGKCLYINLEVARAFFKRRLHALATAAHGGRVPNLFKGDLAIWNLAGVCTSITELRDEVIKRCAGKGYKLIVVDPIYAVFGDLNENSAGDVAKFLGELKRIAVETAAAVLYGHHYAKGNSSQKEARDRASGSGVFTRFPDSIITLTEHEASEASDIFTMRAILRNMPPLKDFVVRWEYPRMERDTTGLVPGKHKGQAGRPQAYTAQEIEACFEEGMTKADWKAKAIEVLDISESTFKRATKEYDIHAGRLRRGNVTILASGSVSTKRPAA